MKKINILLVIVLGFLTLGAHFIHPPMMSPIDVFFSNPRVLNESTGSVVWNSDQEWSPEWVKELEMAYLSQRA